LFLYAQSKNLPVVEAVSEIGSGVNGQRPKLKRLLANPTVQTIVVEHRDRLMRFGAEYVEAALAAQGRKLMVVENTEVKDDLVQDMLEVLTAFSARLYGRRSARNRAQKALHAMGQ
jgi:putative resolvase